MEGGWFKVNRSLIESSLIHDLHTFRLYIFLLSKAAHKEITIAGIKLEKGQYLRSYSKLAEDLAVKEGRGLKKLSKATISRSIKKLIEFQLVAEHETEHGTVFTMLEPYNYQGFEPSENLNLERNLERTWNELGTNLERKQELKELKELKEIYDDDVILIFNQFLSFKENLDQKPPIKNEKDLIAIKRLVDQKISKFKILNLMTNCFNYFQENQNGTISSFAYVEKYILNNLENEKKQKADKTPNKKAAFNKKVIRKETVPDWINNPNKETNQLTPEELENYQEKLRNLKVKKPMTV